MADRLFRRAMIRNGLRQSTVTVWPDCCVRVSSVISPPLPARPGFGTIVSDDHPQQRMLNRYEELRRENEDLRFVRDALAEAGYHVIATTDTEEVLGLMEREQPRLVPLDLVLPGTDEVEVVQDVLRIAGKPVIFISAYGQDQVIARAFEMGTDDYIVKPFSPTELAARVRAAMRRLTGPVRMAPSEPYVRGDLTIDYAQRLVSRCG